MQPSRLRHALRFSCSAFLLLSFVSALWLAWADYLFQTGTPANIRRAAQLVPFHPVYQARAGNLLRAVELDPYFSSAWRELAERAEREKRMSDAEHFFLRAAEVDQQFASRWALANFYFRRGRWTEFDDWISRAAERSYGDRSALFRLAQAGKGRRPVLSLWPTDRELLASYLQYLANGKQWAEVGPAARRLLEVARVEDRERLLNICDLLLTSGEAMRAREIWDAAVDKILPEYREPDAGNFLTNAALRVRPAGKGFDWRPCWRQGSQVTWSPGQLRIDLDGRQFDRTDLLEQFLALAPGRYRLGWEATQERLQGGLRFRIYDHAGSELAMPEHDLAQGNIRQEVVFRVPPAVRGARLILFYERKRGTVRQEGALLLTGNLRLIRALE